MAVPLLEEIYQGYHKFYVEVGCPPTVVHLTSRQMDELGRRLANRWIVTSETAAAFNGMEVRITETNGPHFS